MVFEQFDADGRAQQVDRTALVEADHRTLQPLLGFRLRSKNIRCFDQDPGELPCSSALLPAEGLRWSILAALPGPQAYANRFFE